MAMSPAHRTLRWNPCQAIHYRVNLAHAPKGALADVRSAIAQVHRATGMTLVYDGRTSVVPQQHFGENARAGHAPPLTIAWARPGTGPGASSLLSSRTVGEGGLVWAQWVDARNRLHTWQGITGYVVLNDRYNAVYTAGFGAGRTRGEILLHELGHAMGLQHVSRPSQMMYPVAIPRSRARYGLGDLAGLRAVGRSAGCITAQPVGG